MAATLGPNHASHGEGGSVPLSKVETVLQHVDETYQVFENAFRPDDAVPNLESSLTQKELFSYCLAEFNKDRKILIKNIPSVATLKDIKAFLKDYEVTGIDYDQQSQQAVAVLVYGEKAETAIQALDNSPLLDVDVSVSLSASDRLLCVAHLPPDYTDAKLLALASAYGKTQRTFLMRCQNTGKSKSYGFVEFNEDMERTKEIVMELDWTQVEGHRIHVELIEENLQTWDKLQSRCLLIDNLPWDFMDISKLREMFTSVTSPVYCQIAAKDGKSLGYGIIEFHQPSEAEATWEKLCGQKIQHKPISLSFCIPGRPAVVIYNRIMWKMDKKLEPSNKSSLLPDPLFVSPALLNSPLVKGLTTQFPQLIPTFMKSLHQLHQAYINSVMSRNTKPGLLGPAPYPPISPIMNPNMQLGLIIFIALQMQAHYPQQFTGPLARQLNLLGQHTETQLQKASGCIKPSLLGEPMTARANMLLQNLFVQLRTPVTSTSNSNLEMSSTPKPLMSIHTELPTPSDPTASIFFQQHLQNVKNLNLNLLISLGQVMFSMQSQKLEPSEQQGQTTPTGTQQNNHVKEGLLPNPTVVPSGRNGPLVKAQIRTGLDSATGNYGKNLSNVVPHALPKFSGLEIPPFSNTKSTDGPMKTSLLGEPPLRHTGTGVQDHSGYNNISQVARNLQPKLNQPFSNEGDLWVGGSFSCDDSGYGEAEYPQQKLFNERISAGHNSSGSLSSNNGNNLFTFKAVSPRSNDPSSMSYSGGGLLPTPIRASSAYHPPSHNKTVLSTPVGQKRGYTSLLPEPEPSPEGDYIIGQHSQGIGGHYADTYRKRQKLDHRY